MKERQSPRQGLSVERTGSILFACRDPSQKTRRCTRRGHCHAEEDAESQPQDHGILHQAESVVEDVEN